MKLILLTFSEIKSFLFDFLKSFILYFLSILLTILLYRLIEYLVSYHFRNYFRCGKEYPVYLSHNGNDIKLDITSFDGENYQIVVDINKFDQQIGSWVISSPNSNKSSIFLNKRDVNLFDIIKLFFNTLRTNHNIGGYKRIDISNQTKSNIIRILKNSNLIY